VGEACARRSGSSYRGHLGRGPCLRRPQVGADRALREQHAQVRDARVARAFEIRRADVVRELPNRVTIVVEERRPFTLVHAARLHWMDEDARVLGEEHRAVVPGAPVISGLTEEELASMRTSPGPKARAAVALIRTLLRSGRALAAEISEIDMSRAEGPVLYTVDGIEVRLIARSSDYRTPPWGVTEQPRFLNQVLEVEWMGSARDLLWAMQNVLQQVGRTPTYRWGPREIDVDILLFGDQRIAEPGLEVPHPRMWEREFVMRPLRELRPDILEKR